MENKTSNLSNSLLWFGAAASIAEILAGAIIAPLGMTKGILAIILGHIIGGILFYLAGIIGAKSKLPSIESSRISFGKHGSYLFSALNVFQLIGWTAVMIIVGAKALNQISISLFSFSSTPIWCLTIGILIAVWIIIGIKNLGKVNIFAVGALFVLTLILSISIFKPSTTTLVQEGISFGGAVELGAVMPLSWLPLVGDYTRFSKNEKSGSAVSAISYFIGSCWMYIIGLGAAIYLGTTNPDITQILLAPGLAWSALLIVILSTVTTTFLDVYSAGVSFTNITNKLGEKWVAIIVCAIGTVIAIFTPIEQYQIFLSLIGSVFAPMFAILITDYFIFKKKDINQNINILNIVIWAGGFILYRQFLSIDTPVGSTLPVMIIISLLYILLNKIKLIFSK